jgi:hypothetical protein
MFASTFSLGLVLLPFVSAAVHDVQVGGAGGKLEYSPEAIVSHPKLSFRLSFEDQPIA